MFLSAPISYAFVVFLDNCISTNLFLKVGIWVWGFLVWLEELVGWLVVFAVFLFVCFPEQLILKFCTSTRVVWALWEICISPSAWARASVVWQCEAPLLETLIALEDTGFKERILHVDSSDSWCFFQYSKLGSRKEENLLYIYFPPSFVTASK